MMSDYKKLQILLSKNPEDREIKIKIDGEDSDLTISSISANTNFMVLDLEKKEKSEVLKNVDVEYPDRDKLIDDLVVEKVTTPYYKEQGDEKVNILKKDKVEQIETIPVDKVKDESLDIKEEEVSDGYDIHILQEEGIKIEGDSDLVPKVDFNDSLKEKEIKEDKVKRPYNKRK